VILPIGENQLTALAASGRMSPRMFDGKGSDAMTTRTHQAYAAQANEMAGGMARVRVVQPCPAFSTVTPWSTISLGDSTAKHGRPRRPEVSHP
jgi:hypothetical protein